MLVEESNNLRLVLKEYFEMMHYDVLDFNDGESAIKGYKNGCCNICLLDTDLPKKDGYVVIDEIRHITPELPVIFITERDSKEERIKGFKAGCDDYVTKPFSTEELLLRMEAILKRCGCEKKRELFPKSIIFHIGNMVFNYSELKLKKGDQESMLSRKEAKLLKLLCEHKNKLVPREIITKEIWGDTKAAEGRSLDVFLSKLRKHIKSADECVSENNNNEGEKRKNRYKACYESKIEIVNIHGAGYLLRIKD